MVNRISEELAVSQKRHRARNSRKMLKEMPDVEGVPEKNLGVWRGPNFSICGSPGEITGASRQL